MSTNSSNRLQITAQIAENMIKARAILRLSDKDETKRFHIRGDGNIIPVTTKDGAQVMGSDGQPLFKRIYGIKANSHVAMLNPRNRAILTEAIQAETAGDAELAHSKFNEYLNKIQVSFSVIMNPGRKQVTFTDGQLVEGEIKLITTDNGQLLTVENVRAVAVAKLSATPAFSLVDLMELNDQPSAETVFAPIDGATAPVATEAGA